MKKVLIVEDHVLITLSLKLMLEKLDEDIMVIEAGTFDDALHQITIHNFDLVTLDIMIPGGKDSQMLGIIRKELPEVIILVCSAVDEEQNAKHYIMAGANGFLSKFAPKEEVLTAISTVMNGHVYISKKMQHKILSEAFDKQSSTRLSPREQEITNLLIKGKWTKEIAATLNISASTVSTFKARIFEKMQVSNVMELFLKVKAEETV